MAASLILTNRRLSDLLRGTSMFFFSSLGFEPQAAAAVAAHVRQLSEDCCCSRSSSSCRLFGRRSQRLAPLPRLADVPFSFPS